MIRYFLWACHSNSIIRYGWARQKNILHANAIEKPNSQRLTSLTQRFVVSKANYIILPSQKMEWKKSPTFHRWNFVCSSKSLWIVLRKKKMHWLYPEAICQLHVEESRSRVSFDINFARSVKPWNHEIMRFANYSRRKIQYCVNVKLIVFFSSVFNAPPNREIATKETRKNVCRVEKVSIPGEKNGSSVVLPRTRWKIGNVFLIIFAERNLQIYRFTDLRVHIEPGEKKMTEI